MREINNALQEYSINPVPCPRHGVPCKVSLLPFSLIVHTLLPKSRLRKPASRLLAFFVLVRDLELPLLLPLPACLRFAQAYPSSVGPDLPSALTHIIKLSSFASLLIP